MNLRSGGDGDRGKYANPRMTYGLVRRNAMRNAAEKNILFSHALKIHSTLPKPKYKTNLN